ncbi:MAG: hypothetical protein ACYTEK_03510 [Planctomycetota bacterium]|jgi:hypothetical protein
MPDDNNTPSQPCKTEGHRQHLCHLADEFFHVHHADEYRTMVEKAQFKCLFCARTANSDQNLCYPEAL